MSSWEGPLRIEPGFSRRLGLYLVLIHGLGMSALVALPLTLPPHAAPGDSHSWHLYIVQLTDAAPIGRNDFILALKEAGIGCSVHYRPLHQMTYWASAAPAEGCPAAEDYFQRCVSLPLFMGMSEAEQDYVIATIGTVLGI